MCSPSDTHRNRLLHDRNTTDSSSTDRPVLPWTAKLAIPGPIAALVLGLVCCLVGGVYAYIYYTRINPRSARITKFMEQRAKEEESAIQGVGTHMFLFRKS